MMYFARFVTLADWIHGLGACQYCTMQIACCVIQAENGHKTWGQPSDEHCQRGILDSVTGTCQDLVRKHWKERP